MAFFGGSTILINSASSRLLDEEYESNNTDIVLQAVLTDTSISDAMMHEILWGGGGGNFDTEAFYEYGRDEYIYGLPDGGASSTVPVSTLETIIGNEQGRAVRVLEYRITGDAASFLWFYDDYVWGKRADGSYATPPSPLYWPSNRWVVAGSIRMVSAVFQGTAILITFTGWSPGGADDEASMQLETTMLLQNDPYTQPTHGTLGINKLYYFVRYEFVTPTGSPYPVWAFSYEQGIGVYPPLEGDAESLNNPYYPVVPMVDAQVKLFEQTNTRLYRDASAMFEMLGMDYVEMGNKIFEGPTGEDGSEPANPEDLDYVYMHFGVDITTDEQVGLKYLYDYFNYLRLNQQYDRASFLAWVGSPNYQSTAPAYNRIEISEQSYSAAIEFFFIEYQTYPQVIGPVGTYESLHVDRMFAWPMVLVSSAGYVYHDAFVVKRQVSASHIEAMVMCHPHFFQNINNAPYPVSVTWWEAVDEGGNAAFNFPIMRSVVEDWNNDPARRADVNALMSLSIRITVNSYEERPLEWYQTGAFKLFINIAGVLLSFALGPLGIGIVASVSIASAMATIALGQLLTVFVRIGVEVAMELLDLEGWVATLLLATAATIAVASGRFDAAFNLLNPATNWPLIDKLVNVANIINTGLQEINKKEVELIGEEMAQMRRDAAAYENELEEKYGFSLQDIDGPVLNFDLAKAYSQVGADTISMSDPEAFFTTTLEANPGEASLAMIDTYTDNALDPAGIPHLGGLKTI